MRKYNKEKLYDLYVNQGLSLVELGQKLGVSNVTAKRILLESGIKIRSHSENQKIQNKRKEHSKKRIYSEITRQRLSDSKKKDENKPTRDDLIRLYDTPLSFCELASHYKVGIKVIKRWFKEYNISTRPGGVTTALKLDRPARYERIRPDKSELELLYKKNTIHNIAKYYEVDKRIVSYWFDLYEIDKFKAVSSSEMGLFEYVQTLVSDAEQQNRTIIAPYELDIYIPSKRIAIEYCGIYWHSSKFKEPNYHRRKYLMCKEAGIDLITVFESDSMEKVKTILHKKLKNTDRIYARNCEVLELTNKEARDFNERYHLQGHVNAKVTYALCNQGSIVQLMSFSKNRFSQDTSWEILRLTNGNVTVVGGASRLFKYFIKQYNPETVITYSDLRFGRGQVYYNLDMTFCGESSPNYFYIISGELKSRHQYQKHKLKTKLDFFDPNITEKKNMENNGIYRIYDCGNAKYIWTKKRRARRPFQ